MGLGLDMECSAKFPQWCYFGRFLMEMRPRFRETNYWRGILVAMSYRRLLFLCALGIMRWVASSWYHPSSLPLLPPQTPPSPQPCPGMLVINFCFIAGSESEPRPVGWKLRNYEPKINYILKSFSLVFWVTVRESSHSGTEIRKERPLITVFKAFDQWVQFRNKAFPDIVWRPSAHL